MNQLNARGFAHHFALALVVVVAVIGGSYSLVASHADTAGCHSIQYSTANVRSSLTCVKYIQTIANSSSAVSPKLVVDGQYGPNTAAGIRQFQSHYRLSADGITGARTWATLCSLALSEPITSAAHSAAKNSSCIVSTAATVAKPAVTSVKPVTPTVAKPVVAAKPVTPVRTVTPVKPVTTVAPTPAKITTTPTIVKPVTDTSSAAANVAVSPTNTRIPTVAPKTTATIPTITVTAPKSSPTAPSAPTITSVATNPQTGQTTTKTKPLPNCANNQTLSANSSTCVDLTTAQLAAICTADHKHTYISGKCVPIPAITNPLSSAPKDSYSCVIRPYASTAVSQLYDYSLKTTMVLENTGSTNLSNDYFSTHATLVDVNFKYNYLGQVARGNAQYIEATSKLNGYSDFFTTPSIIKPQADVALTDSFDLLNVPYSFANHPAYRVTVTAYLTYNRTGKPLAGKTCSGSLSVPANRNGYNQYANYHV